MTDVEQCVLCGRDFSLTDMRFEELEAVAMTLDGMVEVVCFACIPFEERTVTGDGITPDTTPVNDPTDPRGDPL